MTKVSKTNDNNLQVSESVNLKENNNSVEDIIKQLQQQIADLQSEKNKKEDVKSVIQENKFDVNRVIKVMHLLDYIDGLCTHLKVDDKVYYEWRKFGDMVYLRQPEFMALYYAQREAFEKNIVGLTSEDDDIAKSLGLVCADTLPINSALLRDFPYMDEEKMTEFYNKLSIIHKELIIRRWYAGFEDRDGNGKLKNPVFADMRKIRFLNDLTGGQMERLIRQMKLEEELKSK